MILFVYVWMFTEQTLWGGLSFLVNTVITDASQFIVKHIVSFVILYLIVMENTMVLLILYIVSRLSSELKHYVIRNKRWWKRF